MSKLIIYMSMSLDGFIAAADDGPGRGLARYLSDLGSAVMQAKKAAGDTGSTQSSTGSITEKICSARAFSARLGSPVSHGEGGQSDGTDARSPSARPEFL